MVQKLLGVRAYLESRPQTRVDIVTALYSFHWKSHDMTIFLLLRPTPGSLGTALSRLSSRTGTTDDIVETVVFKGENLHNL